LHRRVGAGRRELIEPVLDVVGTRRGGAGMRRGQREHRGERDRARRADAA